MSKQTQTVTLIAEIGVNHNGSLEQAFRLIDAAKASGADIAKFQTFKANRLAALETPKVPYQLRTTDQSETHFEMLEKLELSHEQHAALKNYCEKVGIQFSSTPYSEEDVAFLEELGIEIFKTASADLIDRALHERIAASGIPVIVSTGMATWEEVAETVQIYKDANALEKLTLLQCTSAYPADPAEASLNTIPELAKRFGCQVGFSDHTPNNICAIAAVALGAKVIEKHFTLDKAAPGPDHAASATPKEFAEMTQAIRIVETALGNGEKEPLPSEAKMRNVSRKSIIAKTQLEAGRELSRNDLAFMRPGDGLSPMLYPKLIGQRLVRDIEKGGKITIQDLGTSSE